MNFNFKSLSAQFVYLVLGAAIGIFAIYPLTMVIVWLEFAADNPEIPALADFMHARFIFGFLPRFLHLDLVTSFALLGGAIGVGFGFFTLTYMRQAKDLRFYQGEIKNYIPDIIRTGENDKVEFKSSVRWDIQEKCINRGLEKVIAKTLAGFFNTHGGDLLIGVADDGSVLGLGNDYQTLKHQNSDGFERTLNDIIKKMLGGDLCPLSHFTFVEVDGREICMVTVEKAPRPVYFDDGKNSVFYVRVGNSTRQLDVREALDYAQTRWQ
jgi:schlafen family protein